jgi:PAS domain S-box-containing protein
MKKFSPLALRLSVVLVLVIGTMGGVATIFLTSHMTSDLESQFQERGKTLALLLARLVNEGIAEENLDLINRAAYFLDEPDVKQLSVFNELWDQIDGYPVMAMGTKDTPAPRSLTGARTYFQKYPAVDVFFTHAVGHDQTYDFYARVRYRPYLDSPSIDTGFVVLHLAGDRIHEARQQMFRLHLGVAALFCFITIVLLAGLLHVLVVRPVRRLRKDMKMFGQGMTPPVRPQSGDEIGDLTRQFTSMATAIEQRSNALTEQRRYLDTLLTSSNYGITATDAELVIRYFNPRAEALYHCPATEVSGKNIRDIHQMLGLDPVLLEETLALVQERGSYTYTLDQENSDGVNRSLESVIFIIRDEAGLVAGYLLMTYDVTERLKFQRELERSNQELEQFAYVASHDLQEPLRVITGFVQLLEKRYASALDQNGREYMAFIVDAAARMKELINDMLAYSRVTTKTKPPEAVDLNDTLATVRENLSRLIKETRAEISCDQALPMVQADRAQMGQLLQNLITNAIRYHRPEMPPKIRLTAVLQGKEWLISVTDNGIGIEQRYFTRIFKIFQRLHTNDEHPGTGIGLAICKKIIERHQGRIWVQSEPDQGATFLFTLPVMTGFTAERPSAE